jgi:hypothetical protein
MLSSPVYTKSHPRRDAVHAASQSFHVSSKSFRSYPFRTLASHLKATVSSNPFEINRLRTLCKIPGIGYPPSLSFSRPPLDSISVISRHPSLFSSTVYKMLLQQLLCFDNHPFSWGGVYTPSQVECLPTGRCCPVALQQERSYLFTLPAVTDFFFHNEGGYTPSRPRIVHQNETRTRQLAYRGGLAGRASASYTQAHPAEIVRKQP